MQNNIENQQTAISQTENFPEGLPSILHETAYLRIWQIVGDRRRGIEGLLPISRTVFFEKVKSGEFPKPIKIGRSSFWKTEDIKNLIIALGAA